MKLVLGAESGSGIYKLADTQSLTGGKEYIGISGTGTFNQTGGSHGVSYLSVGSSGQYLLSGGTLNIKGGFANKGTLDCNGTGEIVVSAPSILDLSGGTILNAGTKNLNAPTGSLVLVSAGYDPSSTFGSYTNAGMTHVVGTTLTVASDQGFGGIGDIDDLVVCTGTITATSGYAINLNKGLILFGSGNVNLDKGNLTINDTVSCMTGGSLTTSNQYVGKSGAGSFSQSGGTNSIQGALDLGCNVGNTGIYRLSGNGLLSMSLYYDGEHIGLNGTGSFTQSGGSNLTPYLYLGCKSGSSGTYTLSGFSYLKAANEYVGLYGTGMFVQSGGTNIIKSDYNDSSFGWLSIGYYSGSTGSYALSAGLLSATNEYVGYNGNGEFIQTGGTNAMSGFLIVSSKSVYSLSGNSQLSVNSEGISGSFTQTGGKNIIASYLTLGNTAGSTGYYTLGGSGSLSAVTEYVGSTGNSTLTQTGGTNTITSNLYLGNTAGSTGYYTLGGSGSLSAASEYVGYAGNGTFTQTGGTNSITSNLYLGNTAGSTGYYTLGGSGSLSASTEYVGYSGNGTFNQIGGTNSVASKLYIGNNSGSTGTYILNSTGTLMVASGGTVVVGNGSSSGRFVWLGGTLSTPALKFGTYSTLGLGFDFNVASLYNGTLFSGTTVTGLSSAKLEITGGCTATQGGTGSVSISTLYVGTEYGSGNYTLGESANLSVSTEMIGYSGIGSFNQTGGTHTAPNLYLGYYAGASGYYSLSNSAYLSSNYIYIGIDGTGTFEQTGGSNYSTGNSVYLGYYSGATGTYLQSGGSFGKTSTEYVGFSGTGFHIQSGGTHSIISCLYLGYNSGSSGEYDLSNVAYMSGGTCEYIGYSGNGTFTQSGGTNSTAALYLGYKSGSTGEYTLSNGQLSCTSSSYNEGVGYYGYGSFVHSGGTNSIANSLLVGYYSGAMGTYTMSQSASLSSKHEYIGGSGNGSFTQSGGTNTISDRLFVGFYSGSTGAYTLTDGILCNLSPSYGEYIGFNGTGTFTQTGGTNSIATALYLGNNSGSTGTYNLEGGLLITKSISKGSGTAQFNFGGGTLQAGGALSTALDMTLTGTGGDAKIDTAGYDVTLSGILSGDGGLEKQGAGTLILSGANTYTGKTTISGGVLQMTGSVNLDGAITVANGAGIVFGTPYTTSPAPDILGATTNFQSVPGLFSSALSTTEIAPVPEPATLFLLAASLLGMATFVRRKKQ